MPMWNRRKGVASSEYASVGDRDSGMDDSIEEGLVDEGGLEQPGGGLALHDDDFEAERAASTRAAADRLGPAEHGFVQPLDDATRLFSRRNRYIVILSVLAVGATIAAAHARAACAGARVGQDE